MLLNMEDILKCNLDARNEVIEATFKKTVLIRQYETEVVELKSTLSFDKAITGEERVLVVAIIKAQIEFAAYSDLLFRKLITQEEFNLRKQEMTETINALKSKAEQVSGKSYDNLFLD